MRSYKRTLLLILIVGVMMAQAAPVGAYAGDELPPVPKWPVIGPVLRWLGVVEAEQEEAVPTPDPSLPEYRIETWEDVNDLDDIQTNERVRLVVTEKTLTTQAQQAVEDVEEIRTLNVDLAPGTITGHVEVDRALANRGGVEIPDIIKGDVIDLSGTVAVTADNCKVTVDIKAVRANGRRILFRNIIERLANQAIAENWREDICVERVIIDGEELAVEGYRK